MARDDSAGIGRPGGPRPARDGVDVFLDRSTCNQIVAWVKQQPDYLQLDEFEKQQAEPHLVYSGLAQLLEIAFKAAGSR